MKRLKTRNIAIILVLLVVTLNLSFFLSFGNPQEIPNITLNRYSKRYDWSNGTNRLYTHLGPQYVRHYNTNEFTDLVYEDHYVTDGFILVQTSMISIQVYDWYTVFYDPDHDIVCVDDERWIIQVYGKNKKWREVDLYDVTLSSTVNDTHVVITRSLSGIEGLLNVSYVLSASNSLKHDVSFQSGFEESEIFMVIYKLTGIHGSLFSCPESSFSINQTISLKTNRFTIGNGTRDILHEDLRQVINETDRIEIDNHSSGSKIDIYIGNYSLNPLELIRIDPDSDTWEVTASLDDADQDWLDNWDTTDDQVRVVNWIVAGSSWGGCRFLDVGDSVPKDTTITSALLQVYCDGGDDPFFDIYGEDVASPETFGSGTTAINDRTMTSASVEWDSENIGTGAYKDSPDIKTVIQELVNRGDWGSGDDVGILMIPPNDGNMRIIDFESYDDAGSNEPHLYIEWSTGEEYFRTASQGFSIGLVTSRLIQMIKTVSQSITVGFTTSRLIQIALGVTLAVGVALAVMGNVTLFRSASQSITIVLATSRLASFLRQVTQSITIMLATSRGIEVTRYVTQSITISLSGSRLIQVIRNVTQAIGIGLSATGTATIRYVRNVSQSITVAFQTSRLIQVIKQATQSIEVAISSSRLIQVIRWVTQSITVGIAATGELVALSYTRLVTLVIGIGLSTSRIIQLIIGATLTLTLVLSGVGYKIGEYVVSASLTITIILVSSVVTTWTEFMRKGAMFGGIFIILLVGIPLFIIIRRA